MSFQTAFRLFCARAAAPSAFSVRRSLAAGTKTLTRWPLSSKGASSTMSASFCVRWRFWIGPIWSGANSLNRLSVRVILPLLQSVYQVENQKSVCTSTSFPVLRVGSRMVVPKERFKRPAKGLSSIKIRKELNRAARKSTQETKPTAVDGQKLCYFPGYAAGKSGSYLLLPRIGRRLSCRGEAGDVPNLAGNDGAQYGTDPGNRGKRRIKLGEERRSPFLSCGCLRSGGTGVGPDTSSSAE